jgi:hypothetical protein
MTTTDDRGSRRDFVTGVGRLASVAAFTACATRAPAEVLAQPASPRTASATEWDLSWIDRLAPATDRALFDWPSIGDPADPIVLEIAERFLDNCDAAYGRGNHNARVVLNVRTTAVPAALDDATWARYRLGDEYSVKDPGTRQPALRNAFWRRAPGAATTPVLPTLEDMMRRGAIVLVCDFALGHLARRLATKASRDVDDVHRELRAGFVSGAIAVPSGISGWRAHRTRAARLSECEPGVIPSGLSRRTNCHRNRTVIPSGPSSRG